MSDLILPGNMPSFGSDREGAQWLNGKPTRAELQAEMTKVSGVMQSAINGELSKISQVVARMFSMIRTNGLQLETCVRMLDSAVPGFRDNFEKEFQKTIALVNFLDKVNPPGEHSENPIRQRIDIVRGWNAQEDVLKVKGLHFGLDAYIHDHPSEFSEEEIKAFNEEFDMEVTKMPLPEVVTQDRVAEIT